MTRCESIHDLSGVRCESDEGHLAHRLHINQYDEKLHSATLIHVWKTSESRQFMDAERAFWAHIDAMLANPDQFTHMALADGLLALNERIKR